MCKRVCCLYRVSTLKQVEKDDIPMQKQRCHAFADQMGWDIVREFSEKGVSGFKVSAKKRDAIQEIQREAALVVMISRLGKQRKEERIRNNSLWGENRFNTIETFIIFNLFINY